MIAPAHPALARLRTRGRVRVIVRDARTQLVLAERVFENLETQYALNSIATWLVGGAGVVAPAAPSYLALGTGPANLLSANQADFESGTTGWAPASNCTVAQSSAQAWHGSFSLALTASSAASMTATSSTGTSGTPVTAGYQYSASAYVRAASSARQVGVDIAWYDTNGNLLSTSTGTTTADSTTGWTRVGVLATAPSNAVYAAVQAAVTSPANAEVHYLDGVQLAYAPDGPMSWQAGYSGSAWSAVTPSVNDTMLSLERYQTRAKIDTGYAQAALANLLHTYQQTDPAGSFTEAGLWDSNVNSAATLAAQANPGATSLTVSGTTPAVAAGMQIFLPAAPLGSPAISSFTGASTAGGFLAGGQTYYYKLTTVGPNGETIAGAESSYAVPAGTNTNQITLNWAAVTGAAGYKIYRSTSSGGELLLATVGNVTSYVDNTNTTPAGAPPASDLSGRGEYATIAAAAAAGATTWTLTDQLLWTHPTSYPSGTTTLNATVAAFVGNLWAHIALSNVSKTATQLLSLQWELLVANA